jgi:hypothetical protein
MLGLMSRKSCDMVNAANEPRIDRHKSGADDADDSEIAWQASLSELYWQTLREIPSGRRSPLAG